jgi:formyltetrahydrofolate deformylase
MAQTVFGYGCNILSSDQYTGARGSKLVEDIPRSETHAPCPDLTTGTYFQRIHLDFSELSVGVENVAVLEGALRSTAARFNMTMTVSYRARPQRLAILVSKLDHCLYDLLIRNRTGELGHCELAVVASNHRDMAPIAAQFGVRFVYLPMEGEDREAAKAAQEAKMEALFAEEKIDLIVLARYMQVLSDGFCERNSSRTINIHHSFLPAFEGGRPYHRAHERGVKLIGATAHYATAELDKGPIIEQDTERISHRDSVPTMVRKGKDLERMVLARAVRAHLDSRVMVFGNRTVVFEENT